jgi:hypothetical protein
MCECASVLTRARTVTPGITAKEYAQRRENLMARVPAGTVVIVPSHPEMMMSYDIPYATLSLLGSTTRTRSAGL